LFLLLSVVRAERAEDGRAEGGKDFLKREHSLVQPYQSAGFGIPNWDFQGSTIVTNDHVRLTPDQRSRRGALWNRVPCTVRNWEVQIRFKVTGATKDLFGDGFAIWYTRERMEEGSVFGSRDHFSGLAVIADTYSNHNSPHNHKHPYLSAMVNNGSVAYDHDKDGTRTMLGGCEVTFRNLPHETWLSVRYEADRLTVSHHLTGSGRVWESCLTLEGVRLPTGYYFGISASTGDLSDAHDVVTIKAFELDTRPGVEREERPDIQPSAPPVELVGPRKDDPANTAGMSGVKKFFFGLLVVLGMVALLVVGIMIQQNQQENNRKRFY
jgi:mannose-binding lectin 2